MQAQSLIKIATGVAVSNAEREQWSKDVVSLPMEQFIDECLAGINGSGAHWRAVRRIPLKDAKSIAISKRLPSDLVDFYTRCDGFETDNNRFPAPVVPLGNLRLGAESKPALSERLRAYWLEHENPSQFPDRLSVMQSENLLALVNHEADHHLKPTVLDSSVPLFFDDDGRFAAVLLIDLSPTLRRGIVLEFEAGIAIRHENFKQWFAHVASVYASAADYGSTQTLATGSRIEPRKLSVAQTLRRMRPRFLFVFLSLLAMVPWALWKARQTLSRINADDEIVEEAPWFGRTGLDIESERELPRYLRREFGESLADEGSLKARELEYLGYAEEGDERTYYWRIPERKFKNVFATILRRADGSTVTGWGDSSPTGKSLRR